MEELPKLRASRRGHKGHLTKIMKKADELIAKQQGQQVSPMDIASTSTTMEQLKRKQDILKDLGERIQAILEEPEQLEQDIMEHEETQEEIMEALSKLSVLINTFSMSTSTNTAPPQNNPSTSTTHPENNSVPSQSSVVNTHSVANSIPVSTQGNTNYTNHPSYTFSRLPKLSLPTFSGDPLEWLSFWDSFDVGVNKNPVLPNVDKFNYLRAQLSGDAERAIAGYPITNENYTRALDTLKERFGQSHKVTTAHMSALLDIPHPSNNSSSLRSFYDIIETNIRALEALGKSQDSFGDLLVPVIMGKLPLETKRNLARGQEGEDWTIQQLREALKRELRILETGKNTMLEPTPTASFFTGVKGSHVQGKGRGAFKPKTRSCIFCKNDHAPNKCSTITDPIERKSIVTREKRCYNCLASSHQSAKCPSSYRCRRCGGKHHTSICEKSDQPNPSPPPTGNTATQSPAQNEASAVHTTFTPATSRVHNHAVLLKTAISKVNAGTVSSDANILLDEGAQRSFITKELADKLQAKPYSQEHISMAAFGAIERTFKTLNAVIIQIITEQGQRIPLRVLVVPTIAAPLICEHSQNIHNVPHLKGLKLAHPVSSSGNFDINLLIGADYYWDIVQDNVIRGEGGPTAVQSKLGYLLSGPLLTNERQRGSTNICFAAMQHEEFDLERFWSLESMGVLPLTESSSQSFLRNYQATAISRDKRGAYIAAFPWKDDHPPLPTNLSICEKRTRAMARRLYQNPDLLNCYNDIIKDQEARGFIEKVDNPKSSDRVHYIPHHPVKKDSPTTPIRIVYDCSCHQDLNSPSLNDCLEIGPPFMADMGSILVRFRSHPIGLSTDIEKAFLHVGLDKRDRDMTRFLWLSDPNDPESDFQVYRFKSVLFGSASSPFMLNAVLHNHLESFDTPVVKDMRNNLYVDNIITGCSSHDDAVSYFDEARKVLSDAQFNLRSWASNSELLQERASKDNILDDGDEVNILGLRWNTTTDTLSLTQKDFASHQDKPMTKREVLSQSSKIYDPLGIIAPVTVRAKLLMQELWQHNVDWDEPLDDIIKDTWPVISEDIRLSSSMTLPRCYFQSCSPVTHTELHVFADASPKAYGAVSYLKHGEQIALVMAKTRVAPLKKHSLPRLELMAALMGARLAHYLQNALKTQFPKLQVKLWSDSQIVLHWLQGNKQLQQFIRNRVHEITSMYPANHWNYCPTHENPADLLTRGMTAQALKSSIIWLNGPSWLPQEAEWPKWEPITTLTLETLTSDETTKPDIPKIGSAENKESYSQVNISKVMDHTRHSTLRKLMCVTAYVQRFIHNLKNRSNRRSGSLTAAELKKAETTWLHDRQQYAYAAENASISTNTESRTPLTRQLRLFHDDEGLLRCGGRIHNAPTTETAKFPILLPKRDHLTTLIIRDTHARQLHAGVNATLTALRQRFWIPAGRYQVKNTLNRCVTCKKVTGFPYQPPDAPPLTKLRLQEARPFMVTGVDYTGALYVREGKSENKVYICLFTCATTRAVHLEVVSDLSTETFLLAFRRFAARRSTPDVMISDNATTYQAAAKELKEHLMSSKLKQALAKEGVTWKFIPKRAPWYGGFWERLIGLTKTSLKKVLGRTSVNLETLQTIVVEIECILNDRPLTHVSSEINDEQPLTPSHLLYGRRITALPHPETDADSLTDPTYDENDLRRSAARVTLLIQHFWQRWKLDYLTSLREFHGATGVIGKTKVKVGDVVQIQSDDKKRLKWKLGVVEELIEGADGVVRSVHLKTSKGRTNRPLSKLYPLEVTTEPTEEGKSDTQLTETEPQRQSNRAAAANARVLIKEWAKQLRGPPEDVGNEL